MSVISSAKAFFFVVFGKQELELALSEQRTC